MSTPPAPIRSTKKQKGSLRRWVIVLSVGIVSLLLFLIIRVQGAISGREFSPDSFSVRDFNFYELPVLHLQITPIQRTSVSSLANVYLSQTALIQTPPNNPTRWHLVSLSRGFTGKTSADADLLVNQLALSDPSGFYWRQWSIDHAEQAKVFWPIIQRLAQREMYIMMPQLFEIAQAEQSAESMTKRINESMRSQYAGLIRDMRAAQRDELADRLLEEALQDFPDDPILIKMKI